MSICIKRIYEPAGPEDGRRYLVERLWPRGVRKDSAALDAWLRDAAPSTGLRQWFAHDPDKWEAFQQRYRAELDANPAAWQPLLEQAVQGPVTLIYSARDPGLNSALVLRDYLRTRSGQA
ncbi:DUF488 domain-containing protein [Thermithiobacillus plumbiphilus]|uniref:DUF488 domain-containing protein n=1 Tax=Thermithiobacillus plumbiphilus TaxID=1729899 RepID=A0ABU9DAG5_9PROT